jgi:hypothetical protein
MAHCCKIRFGARKSLRSVAEPHGAVLSFWEKCNRLEGFNLNPESKQLVCDIMEALDQMDKFFVKFEMERDLEASN